MAASKLSCWQGEATGSGTKEERFLQARALQGAAVWTEPRVVHCTHVGLNSDKCSHYKMRLIKPTTPLFCENKNETVFENYLESGMFALLPCYPDKDHSLHHGPNGLSELPASFSTSVAPHLPLVSSHEPSVVT